MRITSLQEKQITTSPNRAVQKEI